MCYVLNCSDIIFQIFQSAIVTESNFINQRLTPRWYKTIQSSKKSGNYAKFGQKNPGKVR